MIFKFKYFFHNTNTSKVLLPTEKIHFQKKTLQHGLWPSQMAQLKTIGLAKLQTSVKYNVKLHCNSISNKRANQCGLLIITWSIYYILYIFENIKRKP